MIKTKDLKVFNKIKCFCIGCDYNSVMTETWPTKEGHTQVRMTTAPCGRCGKPTIIRDYIINDRSTTISGDGSLHGYKATYSTIDSDKITTLVDTTNKEPD